MLDLCSPRSCSTGSNLGEDSGVERDSTSGHRVAGSMLFAAASALARKLIATFFPLCFGGTDTWADQLSRVKLVLQYPARPARQDGTGVWALRLLLPRFCLARAAGTAARVFQCDKLRRGCLVQRSHPPLHKAQSASYRCP